MESYLLDFDRRISCANGGKRCRWLRIPAVVRAACCLRVNDPHRTQNIRYKILGETVQNKKGSDSSPPHYEIYGTSPKLIRVSWKQEAI